MIYLDTHAVVWLYDDTDKKFSNKAKEEIRNNDLSISQMVRLELQYLYEIGRIKTHPEAILKYLNQSIGLIVSDSNSVAIFDHAIEIDWTRDVFDRLIVAQAMVDNATLITKDKTIRANYDKAIW